MVKGVNMKVKGFFLKLGIVFLLGSSMLFASIDFNKASKDELMAIKGIGAKKAMLIIEYRKTNKIDNIDSLTAIKGFGPKLISNIKDSFPKKEL